mgnify:CR=1 FL=1
MDKTLFMSVNLSEDEHVALARSLYARWEAGEPTSLIEIDVWGRSTSHGKRFTS